jgi:hypothetical protein
LKTLAQAGYLKEDTGNKTYRYELLQKEPNHLDLHENIRSFSRFHRNSLRKWQNTIETTGHTRHTPVAFLNPNDCSGTQTPRYTNGEDLDKDENFNEDSKPAFTPVLLPSPTSTCPLVPMPSPPEPSLNLGTGPASLDNSERSTCPEVKTENRRFLSSKSVDDFKAFYWSDNGCGWHPCIICGDAKLIRWQTETFKDEKPWLCEDCKAAWHAGLASPWKKKALKAIPLLQPDSQKSRQAQKKRQRFRLAPCNLLLRLNWTRRRCKGFRQ